MTTDVIEAAAAAAQALAAGDDDVTRAVEAVAACARRGDAFVAVDAGVAGAVVDAALPLLLACRRKTVVRITAMTHHRHASFGLYRHGLQTVLRHVGHRLTFDLVSPGFCDAHRGVLDVVAEPTDLEAGPRRFGRFGRMTSARCEVLVTPDVPLEVAQRQIGVLRSRLRAFGWPLPAVTVREAFGTPGWGDAVTVRVVSGGVEAVFCETPGAADDADARTAAAADRASAFISSGAAVQRELAPHLLAAVAAAGGGWFTTEPDVGPHLADAADALSLSGAVACRIIRHDGLTLVEVAAA